MSNPKLLDYFETKIKALLNKKVDKIPGKGLSTEDYTTAEKTKLAGIPSGGGTVTVDSAMSSTSENPVQNKVIYTALGNKVDKVTGKGLSTEDYTTAEKEKLAELDPNPIMVDDELDISSSDPVQNKVLAALLGDTDVSGISDGTLTGIAKKLNENLSSFKLIDLGSVGASNISIASTSWVNIASSASVNVLAGKYIAFSFVNATWTNASYQFFLGMKCDNTAYSGLMSYAKAQNNTPTICMAEVTVTTTGSHTFTLCGRVSNSAKSVTVESYQNTSIILIPIR